MNWNALRFFVMVIVLCVCVLTAAWALNLGKSDGEFHVCNLEPNSHDNGKVFSDTNNISNLSARSYTYRIIEISPKDEPYLEYDPNYPSRKLPKRKYPEQSRGKKDYKIKPAEEHLLLINQK